MVLRVLFKGYIVSVFIIWCLGHYYMSSFVCMGIYLPRMDNIIYAACAPSPRYSLNWHLHLPHVYICCSVTLNFNPQPSGTCSIVHYGRVCSCHRYIELSRQSNKGMQYKNLNTKLQILINKDNPNEHLARISHLQDKIAFWSWVNHHTPIFRIVIKNIQNNRQ